MKEPLNLTEDEILALHDLLVYGCSTDRPEAASRVFSRVSRLARLVRQEIAHESSEIRKPG